MSTQAIMRGFIKGEQKAFNQVFTLYYRELYHFSNKMVPSTDVAEDIVMSAFFELFQRHEQFDCLQKIKGFLYQTLRNKAIDVLASEKSHKARNENFSRTIAAEDNLEFEMIRGELLSKIYSEAKQLPRKRRAVFFKLYMEGIEPREVARQLGMTIDNVYKHGQHALQSLRMRLRDRSLVLFLAGAGCLLYTLLTH